MPAEAANKHTRTHAHTHTYHVTHLPRVAGYWCLVQCRLTVHRSRLVTTWPSTSAGPKPWKSLPDDIISAYHCHCFDEDWKHLFLQSYPDMIMHRLFVLVLAVVVLAVIYLNNFKNAYSSSSSSSSRNECYLGGMIALLLQDHSTMSIKSVCSSQ